MDPRVARDEAAAREMPPGGAGLRTSGDQVPAGPPAPQASPWRVDTPRAPTLLEIGAQVLGGLIALLLAIPVSCMPRSWRERLSWQHRLPLRWGTSISAMLLLGIAMWYAGGVYMHGITGGGVPDLAPAPTWILPLAVFLSIESSVRLLSVMALGEPLGTAALWLVTRPLQGIRRAYALVPGPGDGQPGALPRARLLPRR